MFERFTPNARKIFQRARDEAKRMKAFQLTPEHIMIAMLLEQRALVEHYLKEANVSYLVFSKKLFEEIQRDSPPIQKTKTGNLTFSPSAKKLIGLAFKEADLFQIDYVDVEQVLLACLQEKKGPLGRVIRAFDIPFRQLRALIYEQVSSVTQEEEKAPEQMSNPLQNFCKDLTEMAQQGALDPVIGRADELERLIQILNRRTKNNPVLLGAPGVGKTAIVEGLAQAIVNQKVPEPMQEKRILSLDLASLVAGTKYRGQFEERLHQLLAELHSNSDIILFIDEMHTLVGAGAAEGSFDAANMLKPALSRGEFQCIGATTLSEYRKYIEKDGALERRFQTLIVSEPSVEDTISILKGLRKSYEEFHGVIIDSDALSAASKMAYHYISDRFLPDKAIDVLDEACARVKLKKKSTPEALVIPPIPAFLPKSKESFQTHEQASNTLETEMHHETDVATMPPPKKEVCSIVSDEDVAEVVSAWSGVPLTRLKQSEMEILSAIESKLHQRVIAQNEAIDVVARAIRRSRAGLRQRNRPVGSFLFLGPSGVGKTELARSLAQFLFGDENALIRIDMSEYMEKHSTSRLIGSPPGYVGHEEGGQLTEMVRRKPFSIVLLDEIEKADFSVFNLLLQVLDEGHLTDGMGRRVDFRNTIVIMTSNLGSKKLLKKTHIGFAIDSPDNNYSAVQRTVLDETHRLFTPEFLNRIDEIVVFHHLEKEHLRDILELLINRFNDDKGDETAIEVGISDQARDWLVDKAIDPAGGARPLLRLFRTYIEDALAEKLISREFAQNAVIQLVIQNGKPTLIPALPHIPDSPDELLNSTNSNS